MAREDLHFRLRIPGWLKERVETAAKANKRSMTAEIIAALEEVFGAEGEVVRTQTFSTSTFRIEDLLGRIDELSADVKALKDRGEA